MIERDFCGTCDEHHRLENCVTISCKIYSKRNIKHAAWCLPYSEWWLQTSINLSIQRRKGQKES